MSYSLRKRSTHDVVGGGEVCLRIAAIDMNPPISKMDQFSRKRDSLHALKVGDRLTGGRGGSPLAKRCAFVSRFASKAASIGMMAPKRVTEAARSRNTNLCIMSEYVEMDDGVDASLGLGGTETACALHIYSEACKFYLDAVREWVRWLDKNFGRSGSMARGSEAELDLAEFLGYRDSRPTFILAWASLDDGPSRVTQHLSLLQICA